MKKVIILAIASLITASASGVEVQVQSNSKALTATPTPAAVTVAKKPAAKKTTARHRKDKKTKTAAKKAKRTVSKETDVATMASKPYDPTKPVRRAAVVQPNSSAVKLPSILYGKPYVMYARRTNYTHHTRRPEVFRGRKDWASAKGQSSTGVPLREASNHSPAIFAVTNGNQGDVLTDLFTNEVGVHGDKIGTRWAATCNRVVTWKKVKSGRRTKLVKHVINLHKTPAQLNAPVVDEAKNEPLRGPEYGYFLVVPRIDPRPFTDLRLKSKERLKKQESEIASAMTVARLAQASYFRGNQVTKR